ncbi:MFS general substrate transporter [Cristinia sonorae]|uniref:MFS general substrate transporter n=1 Tax=Cristinia sonorae TaxID=1940300 RepID=A0A8K0URT1_9AGAR|nr:MFS general substrate transporter [Cristinia sonorae]
MSSTPDKLEDEQLATTDIPTNELSATSSVRKACLLFVFCFALFLDAFITSGMIICLDTIATEFIQPPNITSWLVTGYSLTFGSFLLLAGRISDMYRPKYVFIAGMFTIGVFSIGAGFVHSIIGLIVIRAIQGIGAAMTIPSATLMLTQAYPTPMAKGIALTLFAAAGTLGICMAFVIGGALVQFATWRWVVWIVAVVSLPLAAISTILIPKTENDPAAKNQKLDVPGVFAFTASIILLIFALSQAPSFGWGTARVLAPLIISGALFLAFLYWQTRLPEDTALVPPNMWFIPNFLVLVFVSFCTQIYLTGPILILSEYWPVAYRWSPLTIGLHALPMGITSVIVCTILPYFILQLPPRLGLVASNLIAGSFSILLVYSSTRERYWSFTVPSMILITLGSTSAYIISNVGIISSVPPSKVGVAAAIFSAAQQAGGAINIAIVTTILVQVQEHHPYPSYEAPSSAFWYLVGLGFAQTVMVAVFFRPKVSVAP